MLRVYDDGNDVDEMTIVLNPDNPALLKLFREAEKERASMYQRGYEQGRADVINEVYAIAMNENHDTLIEWLQDHISD